VMDAFTGLYRRWTAVRDPAEAHRYVRSSVLNGARSQLRRRRLRRRHESGSPHQEATRDGLETNEADRSTVTQLLRTLPYRQRQVLVLRLLRRPDRSPDRIRACRPGPSIGWFAMTGRQDDIGRSLRSLLLEEASAGLSGDGNDCEQVGNSESGVRLVCAFDMHGIKSDEIGLGPYIDNYWNLTVRDGRIDSAYQRMAYLSNGFSKQMWEPFAAWVRVEHPGDIVAMYTDESQEMQRVTEDSNRLWELRTAEYVAAVAQKPAAYLDQPEVAAYVAQLESICSTAQARVSDEIQAIPDPPNQRALIEVHERIMRETIPELRALALPKAVRWPYEGRAFPLMEEFSQFWKVNRVPPDERQPETLLLSQIQRTPGLDKC
jgi:hypothetical protein